MRRAIFPAALLLLALGSCAATLAVRGTAPVTLSDSPCGYTGIETPAQDSMWVFAKVGSLTDSLWLAPGAPFRFSWQVHAAEYRVTAWAKNAGGASCSSSVSVEAVSRPAAPRLTP